MWQTPGNVTLPDMMVQAEGEKLLNANRAMELRKNVSDFQQRQALLQDLQKQQQERQARASSVNPEQAGFLGSIAFKKEQQLNKGIQQQQVQDLKATAAIYRSRGFETEATKYEQDAKRILDEGIAQEKEERVQAKDEREKLAGTLRGVDSQETLERALPEIEDSSAGKTLVEQLKTTFGDGKGGIIMSAPALKFIQDYRVRNMTETAYLDRQDRLKKDKESIERKDRDRQDKIQHDSDKKREAEQAKEKIRIEKETTKEEGKAGRLFTAYETRLAELEKQENNITIAITGKEAQATALANIARRKRALIAEFKQMGFDPKTMSLVGKESKPSKGNVKSADDFIKAYD